MHDAIALGGKIKTLRRRDGLSQVELAHRLGISPSYLNLIESNKRPLTAALLLKLAQIFRVDLSTFASADDARLGADLAEAFGDPIFEGQGVGGDEARELAAENPAVARAVIVLYRAFVSARDNAQALAGRVSDEGAASMAPAGLPTEEVGDFIQRHQNHFPALEAAAEAVWREAG